MDLNTMQAEVKAVNEANGWFEEGRTFGEDMALIHSEVSEALEAFRDHGLEDATEDHTFKSGDGSVEYRLVKPEGVGSEFADILIRLLDAAERYGIDLDFEYRRKIGHNATRGHRHGGKRL